MLVFFDLNGTLAVDGEIPSNLRELIKELSKRAKVFILSADTHGNLKKIASGLGVEGLRIDRKGDESEAEAKLRLLRGLKEKFGGPVFAVGNGKNDRLILKEADVGICVIGREGASVEALTAADVVVCSPEDAVMLLLREKRLLATLRD